MEGVEGRGKQELKIHDHEQPAAIDTVTIVSLLPSATEIIASLGLEDRLVGVTHECDYPPSVLALPKVTRTLIPTDATSREIDELVRERMESDRALYTLDFPTLDSLAPDIIVTQTLCGVCAVAEAEVRAAACDLPGTPTVINLEPKNLDQVLHSIAHVARILDVPADDVLARLRERIDRVIARGSRLDRRPRVVLLEWIDPPFACGHWNPELVRLAGGIEGLGIEGEPSRMVEWEEVMEWNPEVVVISCCGFTVERTKEEAHLLESVAGWGDLAAVRAGHVHIVDGSAYFSRPGPRLVDSLEILAACIENATGTT